MADFLAFYKQHAPGLARAGAEWRAACPIHNGQRDSFAINPETGKWRCHSDCDEGGDAYRFLERLKGVKFPEAKRLVDEALGLPVEEPKKKREWAPTVATYMYYTADGTVAYRVQRTANKDFFQQRPDGRGGWTNGLGGQERLLYHLPEVLATPGTVYVAEGEKDVDALRELGLNATCNSGGAGKFTAAMAKHLAGRNVVIFPDIDDDESLPKSAYRKGEKHAEQVATLLRLEGCRVKIVKLPAHDPYDFIAAGGTAEQLLELQRETPEWAPGAVAAEPAERPRRGVAAAGGKPEIPCNLHEMLQNYVIAVGSSDVFDRRKWRFLSKEHVRLAHAKEYGNWEKSDDVEKIDAEHIVFKPQGAAEGELNLFRGLPGKPDGTRSCQRIIEHLALVCGGDPDLTRWVTCWLAYPLQHPGAKLRTALVVYGAQGTGKSILFEQVMRGIYGEYLDVIGQFELEGRFNGWASQKLLVICDEVLSDRRNQKLKNRLKTYITGTTVGVEEKQLSRRVEENHMNLVILSNDDFPVSLEDGDRRYTIIRFDTLQDEAYYKALADEIDHGGIEAFHAYLLGFDCGDFNEHTWPYETQAKADLTEECVPSYERFFASWTVGDLPVPYGSASTRDLYEAYCTWAQVSGERMDIATDLRFWRAAGKRWPCQRVRLTPESNPTRAIVPSGTFDANQAARFKVAVDAWLKLAKERKVI